MDIITLPGFKLIGLKLDKKTTNENGQSAIDCGNLWQKFEKSAIIQQISNKLSSEIYAVYYDYEGDHLQPYSYFIGYKVENNATVPFGLVELLIPSQNYFKFLAKGQMPECISNCWNLVWDKPLERAYAYDFEIYDERSTDWNDAEIDIMVSKR